MKISEKLSLDLKLVNWLNAIILIILLVQSAYLFSIHQNSVAIIICSTGILIFGLMQLFNNAVLSTEYSDDGIKFKYPPIASSWATISLSDIKSIQLKTNNPLKEFGGWGWRSSGTATGFITSSKKTVWIEKKNGKCMVLSISDEGQIQKFIDYISPKLSQ